MLVSDNGDWFVSEEFKKFCMQNHNKHITSTPYDPSSNAERAVQTFRQGMKRLKEGSLDDKISRFLFKYRINPHTSMGVSPAELLQGRNMGSTLDLLHPNVEARVTQKREAQKKTHNKTAGSGYFQEGEKVHARNFTQRGPKSVTVIINEVTGPVKIQLENAVTFRPGPNQECFVNDPGKFQSLDKDWEPNQVRDNLHIYTSHYSDQRVILTIT